MSEKRRHKRHPRRVRIEFGEKDFAIAGYTHDISKSGAFVIASRAPPLKSIIHLKLVAADGRWFACEGEVRWRKEVPPALRQMQQSGFGVRFLFPDELVEALLPNLKSEKSFRIQYDTEKSYHAAFAHELRLGAAFVRTELALQVGAEVSIELRLEFAQRTLEFPAKVFQLMPADKARGITAGVVLQFVDKEKALKTLSEFVPAPAK